MSRMAGPRKKQPSVHGMGGLEVIVYFLFLAVLAIPLTIIGAGYGIFLLGDFAVEIYKKRRKLNESERIK